MKKAVVAHAGSRDHYQLALALQEANLLEKLVTDFYSPEWLLPIHSNFKKRYTKGLSFNKISIPNSLWIKGVYAREKDLVISEKAYSIAQKNNTNLFLYSYYAFHAFNKAEKKIFDGQKYLFQIHPHPKSVRRILKEEIELIPLAKSSLEEEPDCLYSDKRLEELSAESLLADKIVVSSTFTKNTLIENGTPPTKISVIPYGVDTKLFRYQHKSKTRDKNAPLKVLFVGQMTQRKGISYLLEAVNSFPEQSIQLTLCGRGLMDIELITSYSNSNLKIKKSLTFNELLSEFQAADVFVLPSVVEGFGLVILEAMATGLPVITTQNTGGADIINSGENGFLISIRDTRTIIEKLELLMTQPELRERLGIAARATAETYSWQEFRKQIVHFYRN